GITEDTRPFPECEVGCDDDGGALVEATDKVEQELAAGLGEGQIAEFVKNDEVHAGELFGDPTLPSVRVLDLGAVDEIDDVVEPATGAGADTASGDSNGQMSLAGSGPTDQNGVALLGDEPAAGEVPHERLVDGCALELEVVEVLGERQLGDGELVLDRARLLLVDLGVEQITDDALGFMLSFDCRGHDLVEGGLHAIELEFAHEIEELGSFHQLVLLRLS